MFLKKSDNLFSSKNNTAILPKETKFSHEIVIVLNYRVGPFEILRSFDIFMKPYMKLY